MIELQHFSIGYKENSLLHEVNATIKKGQLTALIGRNGTGKSTLLRAIAGLNRCYSGKIILDGHDIAIINGLLPSLFKELTPRIKRSEASLPGCPDCC